MFSSLFLASYGSLLFELSLAKVFSLLSDDGVLWESLTIGVFLFGIGLGVLWGNRSSMQSISLASVEKYLFFLGLVSYPLIEFIHIYYRIYLFGFNAHSFWILRGILGALEFLPLYGGVLTGLEVGLLYRRHTEISGHRPSVFFCLYEFGAVLAAYTVTSVSYLCNSDSLPFLLGALCHGWIYTQMRRPFWGLWKWKLACLALGIIGLEGGNRWMEQWQLKTFYYNQPQVTQRDGRLFIQPFGLWEWVWRQKEYPAVERLHSHYQVLDLVSDTERKEWALYLNHHFQLSTETEYAYHHALAAYPMTVAHIAPKTILVLGAGDGFLVRELLKYPSVEKIVLVELDPAMLEWAKGPRFSARNEHSLFDSRVEVVAEDAWWWVRHHTERFDAILLDFPYPYGSDGLRLYSTEFFSFLRHHLQPRGYIALDVPLWLGASGGSNEVLLATLQAAGFPHSLGFQSGGETFLYTGVDCAMEPPPWTKQDMITPIELPSVSEGTRGNHLLHPRVLGFPDRLL
jgi:spermidine synthase